MRSDDIVTDRLCLISITPESAGAEKAADGRLGEVTGADVAEGWPPENWEPHVFDWLLAQFAADAGCVGWNRYIALRDGDGGRTLIGTVGGFRKAESMSECEVGYSVVDEYQGLGYATEALEGLMAWIWEDETVASVCAQTFPALAGSVRVMEKCGMRLVGAGFEDGTVLYRVGR
ncbi:GCN5-related N-acetyltransferase [Granulicella tundricola MP5ACTX9]|uniref:GCN5-related N-acetyltransferase n=2 Tax=Granulicella TaxID=940557 RepID=E8X1M8_GRATM|nr:GCN5-related N-acetyltransferase [Granulicella tundricola MP5ACTX9]